MATTIQSNYYAITQARAATAVNSFNLDFTTILQSTNTVCEIAITEAMLATPYNIYLPKIEVLHGNPSFTLIIRDANRNIGPGEEVIVWPYDDGIGVYADCIGSNAPGASVTIRSNGIRLFWCASPTPTAPNSGFWGIETQAMP